MVVPKVSTKRGINGKVQGKTLLVAQEISFAKVLAGNDKKLRDRGVKRLRKWLTARSQGPCVFTEDDFMRIWKGLFYCMWMSDKPLIQEDLAESISCLVHCFKDPSAAFKFLKAFFRTMATEWSGIDQHRLDKFLMLVRRFLRQSLFYVERCEWSKDMVGGLGQAFTQTLLPDHTVIQKIHPPLGLVMHFIDIFLEELSKVSKGKLPDGIILCLLRPFVSYIAVSSDGRVISEIRKNLFNRLINQSPQGIEYQEKFQAWKKLGFPGGTIDAMELAEGSEEEDEEKMVSDEDDSYMGDVSPPLDPRAGHVDVELPVIDFDPAAIAKLIREYRFKKYTNSKSRKSLATLAKRFDELAKGDFPLGIKKVPETPDVNLEKMTNEAAKELLQFEEEFKNRDDESDGLLSNIKSCKASDMEVEEESDLEGEEESDLEGEEDSDLEGEEDSDLDGEEDSDLDGEEDSDLDGEEDSDLDGEEDSDLDGEEDSDLDGEEDSDLEGEEGDLEGEEKLEKEKAKSVTEKLSTAPVQKVTQLNLCSSKQDNSVPSSPRLPTKVQNSPKVSPKIKQCSENGVSSISAKKIKLNSRTSCSASPGSTEVALKKTHRYSNDSLKAVNSNEADADAVCGADILLKRLASHVVGDVKLKRRASLPARLDTLDSNSSTNSPQENPKVKRIKRALNCTSDKKKDPWDVPLQEGETEIFVPRSALIAKRRSLQMGNDSLKRFSENSDKKNPFVSPLSAVRISKTPGSSNKKVNFVLQRNTAQATSEYFKTLQENPDIPFDASKKPSHGVLKPSPYSSPINPFYKRKLRL